MLRRHAGERLWAVDHWAALRLDGQGGFRVLALPGRQRAGGGPPVVRVVDAGPDGALVEAVLPPEGRLQDWVRPAAAVVEDPGVEVCRRENPVNQ